MPPPLWICPATTSPALRQRSDPQKTQGRERRGQEKTEKQQRPVFGSRISEKFASICTLSLWQLDHSTEQCSKLPSLSQVPQNLPSRFRAPRKQGTFCFKMLLRAFALPSFGLPLLPRRHAWLLLRACESCKSLVHASNADFRGPSTKLPLSLDDSEAALARTVAIVSAQFVPSASEPGVGSR